MTTVAELITHLQTHFQPDDTIATPIWHADDVIHRAAELGKRISREEAENVIDAVDDNHDACLGITWDTIDCYLSQKE